MAMLDKLKATVKTTTVLYGQSRKAAVAVLPPGYLLFSNYVGGQPVAHLWNQVFIGTAAIFGVHMAANDPPSSLPPSGPPSTP